MKQLSSTPIVQVIPQITIKDVAKLVLYYQFARAFDALVAKEGTKLLVYIEKKDEKKAEKPLSSYTRPPGSRSHN